MLSARVAAGVSLVLLVGAAVLLLASNGTGNQTQSLRFEGLEDIVAGGLGVGANKGTGGNFAVPKTPEERKKFVDNLMKNLKQGKDADGKATKAPRDHTGIVWWKLPESFKCVEDHTTKLPADWGTCEQAAAAGGCTDTEFSIREICCKTCCCKVGGDVPSAAFAKMFNVKALGANNCVEAKAKGLCTKDHNIKKFCCQSCQNLELVRDCPGKWPVLPPPGVPCHTPGGCPTTSPAHDEVDGCKDQIPEVLEHGWAHGLPDAKDKDSTGGTPWKRGCQLAAAQGWCKRHEVCMLCPLSCESCPVSAEKRDDRTKNGFGIGTINEGGHPMCAPEFTQPEPEKPCTADGCCDATNAVMEKEFKKGASCSHAVCSHEKFCTLCPVTCKTCPKKNPLVSTADQCRKTPPPHSTPTCANPPCTAPPNEQCTSPQVFKDGRCQDCPSDRSYDHATKDCKCIEDQVIAKATKFTQLSGKGAQDESTKAPTPKSGTQSWPSCKRDTGCANSQYGCCADGSTFATGPNKAGCGGNPGEITEVPRTSPSPPPNACPQGSREACNSACPSDILFACMEQCRIRCGGDKPTPPPSGPPVDPSRPPHVGGCTTTQYGCCDDGVNAATGPNKAGCGGRKTPPPRKTPPSTGPTRPPGSCTNPPCTCKDATPAEMAKKFAEGASCQHAAANGACKSKEVCMLCPESCNSCPTDGESTESQCPKPPVCTKPPCPPTLAPARTRPPWVPSEEPAAPPCVDASAREMGDAFGKGSSCQEAASQGHCNKGKIRSMCCAMCKCADKMGNTKNGGGATIEINDKGQCKAYNPHSADENCFDSPLKVMEEAFGPAASCGHAVAMGQCNAGKKIKRMCCASCGGLRPDAAKMNGGSHDIRQGGNGDRSEDDTGGHLTRPPAVKVADELPVPEWLKPKTGCKDISQRGFTDFWHETRKSEIEKAHTKKETRNCVHAMFTGLCKDAEIKSHCCGSCTADDGAVCVDKPAGELASILGKPGVSCGLLAQAGRCDHSEVKKNCCARCRKTEFYEGCKKQDVTEQELKALIGDDGEGGCEHAAALGKCEKSSTVHASCCRACTLHRDIEQ